MSTPLDLARLRATLKDTPRSEWRDALRPWVQGKRVAVVGLGKSGVEATRLLTRLGCHVLANDHAPLSRLSLEAQGLSEIATLVVGGHDEVPWLELDAIVLSPGVPRLSQVEAARARGVPVHGELELAWALLPPTKTCAIGGTNGKSTTTSLVGAMAAKHFPAAFVGGNLGTPLSSAVFPTPESRAPDLLVLEVSSFQAESMTLFRPDAACLLNITEDHLDRYESFASYAAAKGEMFVRMTAADTAVIPEHDEVCRREASRGGATVLSFGAGGDVEISATAITHLPSGARFRRGDMKLEGEHNAMNVAAALSMALAVGIPVEDIAAALASFAGLSHRTAKVATLRGVTFYDDSKGTNVGATLAALTGLQEPRVVLLAGGRDKHGSYEPLAKALQSRGRAVVVIGEAAERIAAAVEPSTPTRRASSMEQAVRLAFEAALPGDAVLLSPACSSFDMFRDYKHRGDVFVAAVHALAKELEVSSEPSHASQGVRS